MRDAPTSVANGFSQIGVSNTIINLKGLSCPSANNVFTLFYPETILPYYYLGKTFKNLSVSYSVEDANVGTKPIDVFNTLYHRWHKRIPQANVLERVVVGDVEYMFGNSIIVENKKPLVVCLHLRDVLNSKTIKKILLDVSIFNSFNPFHKYILQKIVPYSMPFAHVSVENLESCVWKAGIDHYFELKNEIYNKTSVLLNHLEEIYGNIK